MDSIDQAAAAFDADMGNRPSGKSSPSGSEVAKKPEPIFDNLGDLDPDSPGLSEEDRKFADRPRGKKAKTPDPDESDDSDEDLLAAFDDGLDPNADDGDDADPDKEDDEDADPDREDDEDDTEDDDDELMSKEFEVMVDGEPQTVTLDEALKGFIRTETFHKRLSKLSEAQTQLRGFAEDLASDREKVQTMLTEAEEIVKAITPEEPNWDEMFEKDPKAARELQKTYNAFKAKADEIRAKRQKLADEEAEKAATETADFAKKEYVKFASTARWQNKDDQAKDLKSMRRTALAAGLSEQEISRVYDSRMLTILLKASKFDRIMAARPKATKRGKTPVSPGAGSKGTARKGIVAAQKQLARTGNVEDAAPVFDRILRGK